MDIKWKLRLREFKVFQFSVVSALVLLSLFSSISTHYLGHGRLLGLIPFLNVGEEQSLPTYFSSINLLLSALLLFLISVIAKRRLFPRYRYWLYLSLLFLLLSVDEATSIHEKFNQLQEYTGVMIPVIQTHSWLLYGVLFTIIVGVFFLPFLISLPTRTALLMVLAGTIFLGGAIGFETLGAWLRYRGSAGYYDLIGDMRRLLEESLEMYGIALFNSVLFKEIVTTNATIIFRPAATQGMFEEISGP
jgi:hypothetical protein